MSDKKILEIKRCELQGLMVFAGSLAYGLEQMLGRGATSINFRAGRNVGFKGDVLKKTDDIIEALDILKEGLARRGINWELYPWKPAHETDYLYEVDGKKSLNLG